MKRRTVIAGIGAIGATSGTVALTSATLAESVTPTTDFRAIVTRELTARRGEGFLETDPQYQDTELDFGTLEETDVPLAYVNEQEDNDLAVEVAIENDADEYNEDATTFAQIIEIENLGQSDEEVGIENYAFGEAVTGGAVTEQNVLDLFQFEVDGTKISPEAPAGDAANFVTVGAGETVQVDLVLDLDEATQGNIAEEVDTASGDPWEGAFDDVDLLDTIDIGIEGTA